MFKSVNKLFGKSIEEQVQILLIDYLESLKSALAGQALAEVAAANVERASVDAAFEGVDANSQFEFSQSFSLFAGGLTAALVGTVLPEASDEDKLRYAGLPLTAVFGVDAREAVEMILAAAEIIPHASDAAAMPTDEAAYDALSEDQQFAWQIFASVQFAVDRLISAVEDGQFNYELDQEEVDNLSNVMAATVVS